MKTTVPVETRRALGITMYVVRGGLVPLLPNANQSGWKGAVRVKQTMYYSLAGLKVTPPPCGTTWSLCR